MNFAEIKECDIANGPGVRVTLFVSGCTRRCEGCFNPEAWDFQYGEPFTKQTASRILEALSPDYITGLTLLGGEPLEYENWSALLPFLRLVRERFPKKDIWCYTGYLFDQDIVDKFCLRWPEMADFLNCIDVIVDGAFVLAKKNISLQFRGSENQRIIRVGESLKQKKIILWD